MKAKKVIAIITAVLISTTVAAQDKQVISVFSGEYVNPETVMFFSLDAWSNGKVGESSKLSGLYAEGWAIVDVLKTNASASTLQLLIFLEIDATKFPDTAYSKYLEEDSASSSRTGSIDDL
jgi:hypothetical protein